MKFKSVWHCNECDIEINSLEAHYKEHPDHTYIKILRPEGKKTPRKEFDMINSMDESFTTSTNFQTKLEMLKGPNLPNGQYKLHWNCEYYQSSTKERTIVRLYNNSKIEYEVISNKDNEAWQTASGAVFVDLVGENMNFKLVWATTNKNDENAVAGIRNAVFEFRRIA